MRILIANRGEIARRLIRTAHRLGHETVAIYAEPDADAPFVSEATMALPLGPASLAESYLSIERVLAVADAARATAVHPGYGFLAENAAFAQACLDQGLAWIGPNPGVIASMGSKIEARQIAERAGVPIIPGWSESQDPTALALAAEQIGFPVLVKAAAGGGGKGIRIATSAADFAVARAEASTEAERSFGDGRVIVERYIQRPRHIEVQIVADRHGRVVELGTRECSVQRRYQKLLEEAPAPNLPEATRTGIRTSARDLAEAMEYDSAGTVEFIVDDETGEYFFLEVNTRLQVEHPVTELVTGIDLVEIMIRVAMGEPLPLESSVQFNGHAVEARILAEDPANGFVPQVGVITQLHVPEDVRWDGAIEVGSEVSPHYDSMIAKLIVHGATRSEALAKLRRALDELIVDGLATTAGFHRWLLDQQPVVDANITTRFLDEHEAPTEGPTVERSRDDSDPQVDPIDAAAAGAWLRAVDAATPTTSPWLGSNFSITPKSGRRTVLLVDQHGSTELDGIASAADLPRLPAMVDLQARRVAVNCHGYTYGYGVPSRTEHWAPQMATRKSSGEAIVAPYPALVSEVPVESGDAVEGDEVIVVIEAMKMLHALRANGAAVIDEVRVAPGDQVATNDVLVTFLNPSDESKSETP